MRKKRPTSFLTKTSRSKLNKRSTLPNVRSNKRKTHQMMAGELLRAKPRIMASLWPNQRMRNQTLLLAHLARSTLRRAPLPNSRKSPIWRELMTTSPTLKVKLSASSKTEWVRKTAQILACLARRLNLPKTTIIRRSAKKRKSLSLLAPRKKLSLVAIPSQTSKTASKTTTFPAWAWANLAQRPRRNVVKATLLKDSKMAALARTSTKISQNLLSNNKFTRKRICPISKQW